MAITLISNIKQANNGTFALIDSNDIAGGLYHVDTVLEMNALPVERLKIGMLCYVTEHNRFYQYQKNGQENSFVEWSSGFNKSEVFAELDNKTIIASIVENSTVLDDLQAQLNAITGADGGDTATIAGLNSQINSLKETIGTATIENSSTIFERIEALEASLADIAIATEEEILAIINSL